MYNKHLFQTCRLHKSYRETLKKKSIGSGKISTSIFNTDTLSNLYTYEYVFHSTSWMYYCIETLKPIQVVYIYLFKNQYTIQLRFFCLIFFYCLLCIQNTHNHLIYNNMM